MSRVSRDDGEQPAGYSILTIDGEGGLGVSIITGSVITQMDLAWRHSDCRYSHRQK